MDDTPNGIVGVINTVFGGGVTSLFGAAVGRLMYHTSEARAKRRPMFGWELVWEIPVAIGMAIVGEGLSSYWGLLPPVSTAIVAVLSYLGPRGAERLLERWFNRNSGGKE